MAGINNAVNHRILDAALFGTTSASEMAKVAVSPTVSSGNVTTGLLVNPIYSPSSGTVYGGQINPLFNPQAGNAYQTVYGLFVAPTISPGGTGSVMNAYGVNIEGPSLAGGQIGDACSLYVANPRASGGAIQNKYTAVFEPTASARVGIGMANPATVLDINGVLSANRADPYGALTINRQRAALSQGDNQGGLGGGAIGSNRTMSANTTEYFDLAAVDSKSAAFKGCVFDGRFIYFVPSNSQTSGTIIRYDTANPFNAAASYTIFSLTKLDTRALGYWGGSFDGRYVYFVPNLSNGKNNYSVARYDTTRSFTASESYTLFNLRAVHSFSTNFRGAVFDGRYVYFIPGVSTPNPRIATRFDTLSSFTATSSYTIFSLSLLHSLADDFVGGVFDGRYVYFSPYQNETDGYMVQYDTARSFTSVLSWTVFNTETFSAATNGFTYGTFDGRYCYFSSQVAANGNILRYDSLFSFTNTASYTIFDATRIDAFSKNFAGAIFDGRYVYIEPYGEGTSGSIVRYDTSLPFDAISSYTVLNTTTGNSNSFFFSGGVFDGRYVYFVPANLSLVTRVAAYSGPQATAMAAPQAPNGFAVGSYAGTAPPVGGLIVPNKMIIGATSAAVTLYVNGSVSATNVIGLSTAANYATGGTTRNQLITLAEGYDQGGFGSGLVGTNKQMGMNTTAYFNTTALDSTLGLFIGGVFDGRYFYQVPNVTRGTVTRYDTTALFTSASSHTVFCFKNLSSNVDAFYGGAFDGRYIYFGPTSYTIVRYDTELSFTAASSYTLFDIRVIHSLATGHFGIVFDGRYIYTVPFGNSIVTRYDTTRSFTVSSSYTPFNLLSVQSGLNQFAGALYDGRYVYWAPYQGGGATALFPRYDTSLSFTSVASWTVFNVKTINASAGAYSGGCFDGRYIYLTPYQSSILLRYDSTASFTIAKNFTTFNLSNLSTFTNYNGGVFDGRYIYLVPGANSNNGSVCRYDTTQSFNAVGSYTILNTTQNNSSSRGFYGGMFDGKYVYFVRYNFSIMTRIDACPAPQTTLLAASGAPNGFAVGTYAGTAVPSNDGLIASGNAGVGTSDPQFALDVNGELAADAVENLVLPAVYATGGTTRNQLINLAIGYDSSGLGSAFAGTNRQMSLVSATFFDMTTVHSNSVGFRGGVFDGRYIYLVPNTADSSGQITRYDATQTFNAASSYTTFDLSTMNTNYRGYNGGCFDGRYVYFVPYLNGVVTNSTVVRYDSTGSFSSSQSYTVFNLLQVHSKSYRFQGAVFDGRYIYFFPYISIATRFDTTVSFTTASSYTTFELSQIDSSSMAFYGGIFDGRYVYFVPGGYYLIQYDTAQSFSSVNSWTLFDSRLASAIDFHGGVFDGRYCYFAPRIQSLSWSILRYDTTASFTNVGSYTNFDIRTINNKNSPFAGAVFDGRYVYFVPGGGLAPMGSITRYDVTLPFRAATSYTIFNTNTLSPQCMGFWGAVFDGRYIYLVPYYDGTTYSGRLTRIDASPGPQVNAIAAMSAPNGLSVGSYAGIAAPSSGSVANALIVSGNVGIGTASPQYALDVNGTINAAAINAASLTFSGVNIYYNLRGLLTNNQNTALSQGHNQGGFGGGSVGTNKRMSANSATCFDTTAIDSASKGFIGAVFDGTYLYFAPNQSGNASGSVTRYDTTLPFSSPASYTVFDISSLSPGSVSCTGGVYDGRYVYFPSSLSGANKGIVTRYDSKLSFTAGSSYTVFDTTTVHSNAGLYFSGAYDGRYVYFVQFVYGTAYSLVTRYDPARSFTAAASFTVFDLYTINSTCQGFKGAVYDGRYIYFAPFAQSAALPSSTVVRFDTSLSFGLTSSYTLFNLGLVHSNAAGFEGSSFDSRYVYWTPTGYPSGSALLAIRYDTLVSFTVADSYTWFDLTAIGPSPSHAGAVYDGRYLYLAPGPGVSNFTIVRHDTTRLFTSAASWTAFDTSKIHPLSAGFYGCAWDGRYVYLVPNPNGAITRLDGYPGPRATSMAAFHAPNGFAVGSFAGTGLPNVAPAQGISYTNALIVSGKVGVGTANPTFSLHLAADSAAKPSTNTWTINSDVRIKRDIQDIPDALTKIGQLRPRKFQFTPEYAKGAGLDPDQNYYGFVADEVETVLDGCVHRHGTAELKSLNIHNILIYYIQAIRELSEMQNHLQHEIDNLK